MTETIRNHISQLKQELRQLRERQRRIEARRQSLQSRRDRREETRRKILVGAIVLARVDRGDIEKSLLDAWLDQDLTRAEDRALFDLQSNRQGP